MSQKIDDTIYTGEEPWHGLNPQDYDRPACVNCNDTGCDFCSDEIAEEILFDNSDVPW